jgi:hypothetical protein
MSKDQIKEVLDRVLTWAPERQEDVVEVLRGMELQDRSICGLNDEQTAEVRRRLAENDPKVLTLTEFNERVRQYGA